MAKVGIANIGHRSPKGMINLTNILAILTPILPPLIQSMPGSVSATTKEWILWIMSCLTAISAAITVLTKSKTDTNGISRRSN